MAQKTKLVARNPSGLSADQILALQQLDSVGYLFCAMAWLDYYRRFPSFNPLQYAAISARKGIEYLFFEALLLGLEGAPTEVEYQKWLKSATAASLKKLLKNLSPRYERLQAFSCIVAPLEPNVPKLRKWNQSDLMMRWGQVSELLHWNGAYARTTDDETWLGCTNESLEKVITPMWINIMSGHNGLMPPEEMHAHTRMIWDDYDAGRIDDESARLRLELMRPSGVVAVPRR